MIDCAIIEHFQNVSKRNINNYTAPLIQTLETPYVNICYLRILKPQLFDQCFQIGSLLKKSRNLFDVLELELRRRKGQAQQKKKKKKKERKKKCINFINFPSHKIGNTI